MQVMVNDPVAGTATFCDTPEAKKIDGYQG